MTFLDILTQHALLKTYYLWLNYTGCLLKPLQNHYYYGKEKKKKQKERARAVLAIQHWALSYAWHEQTKCSRRDSKNTPLAAWFRAPLPTHLTISLLIPGFFLWQMETQRSLSESAKNLKTRKGKRKGSWEKHSSRSHPCPTPGFSALRRQKEEASSKLYKLSTR